MLQIFRPRHEYLNAIFIYTHCDELLKANTKKAKTLFLALKEASIYYNIYHLQSRKLNRRKSIIVRWIMMPIFIIIHEQYLLCTRFATSLEYKVPVLLWIVCCCSGRTSKEHKLEVVYLTRQGIWNSREILKVELINFSLSSCFRM